MLGTNPLPGHFRPDYILAGIYALEDGIHNCNECWLVLINSDISGLESNVVLFSISMSTCDLISKVSQQMMSSKVWEANQQIDLWKGATAVLCVQGWIQIFIFWLFCQTPIFFFVRLPFSLGKFCWNWKQARKKQKLVFIKSIQARTISGEGLLAGDRCVLLVTRSWPGLMRPTVEPQSAP